MILMREVRDPFASDKFAYWTQQIEVEDLDGLLATMSEAMESEGITKPRAFEVIEVTVTRKVVVEREVQQNVIVNVKEG